MRLKIALTLCAALGCTGVLADEPGFSWSRATLKLVDSGDPVRGKAVARTHKCKKCHGKTGTSEENDTPSIAGQVPAYQFKQLMDYKSGVREEKTMNKRARKLTPEDMADLAAYYATQAPVEAPERSVPELVADGDMDRLLLPCSVCHGKQGEGLGFEVPALAGQRAEHLVETLEAFREGDRENDEFGRMRFIAKQLTDDEIEEVAEFYGTEAEEEEEDDD